MITKRTILGAALLAAIACTACAARRVDLVNDTGHRVHCTAEGYGWGALGTDAMVDDCVAELEAKGYRRVDTAAP